MKQNNIKELPKLDATRLENLFNIYTNNTGEYFYNILNTVNFNTENLSPLVYDNYSVISGDTYTYISYKKYNTIDLWWLICCFNNIQNPTKRPEPGITLRLLKKEYVSNIITKINEI